MTIRNLRLLLASGVVLAACSVTDPPEPQPLVLTIATSHQRITTPGRFALTVQSPDTLSRVEIFTGGIKVGESLAKQVRHTVEVTVTAADNGTRSYVAKGFNSTGAVGESNPVTVDVDIRWDLIRQLGEWRSAERFIATDATGNVYIAGSPVPDPGPSSDQNASLAKYDSEGNRLWVRTFGGPKFETTRSVGVDPSGRAYLTGHISDLREPSNCFLVVYDAAGSIEWGLTVAKTEAEAETHLTDCVAATDAAGNYYLAGRVLEPREGSDYPSMDIYVVKFDASGNVLWRRQFGSQPGPFIDADNMGDIVVDRLGGVYVGGSTNGSFDNTSTTGENDAFVVKLDAEGNKLWERQLGTDKHDYVYDLAADPDGGVYLTGPFNFQDAYVARYSPDGTRLWNRVYDGGNADNGSGVAVNASTVYIVGFTRVVPHESRESGQGKIDGFLAEFSRTGDMRSFRLLGGPEDDFAFRVALGLNGGVYVLAGTWGGLPDIPNPATLLARHRSAAP